MGKNRQRKWYHFSQKRSVLQVFTQIPATAVTSSGGVTAAATIKVTITTLNNRYRRRKLTNNYR